MCVRVESVRSSAQSSQRQVAWACARPRSCSMAFDIRCRLGILSCSQYQSTVAQNDRCRFARVRKARSCAVTDCEAYMSGLHFPHRTVAACTNRICCRICCGYHFPASMQAVPVSHARAAWAPLHHVCRSIGRQTACLQSPSVIVRVGLWLPFQRLHMGMDKRSPAGARRLQNRQHQRLPSSRPDTPVPVPFTTV